VTLSSRSAVLLRGLLVAAALIPVLSACEAGLNAPTQRWHQPTPGASAVVNNSIRINNMFVLGAPPGTWLAAGASAGVFLALANNGAPDTLLSVSAPGSAGSVQLPGNGVRLARYQQVLLTGPVPQIILRNLTRPLNGGQFVRMVLNFRNAGSVALTVPVMPRAQFYVTYSPAPPSPSPSPTATPARRHKPHASPSPSPTPTG
jgi:copper(I)-binding protein